MTDEYFSKLVDCHFSHRPYASRARTVRVTPRGYLALDRLAEVACVRFSTLSRHSFHTRPHLGKEPPSKEEGARFPLPADWVSTQMTQNSCTQEIGLFSHLRIYLVVFFISVSARGYLFYTLGNKLVHCYLLCCASHSSLGHRPLFQEY